MPRIQKLFNEFGKTYYTLPLTITNVLGGVLILKKLYVQNNLEDKESIEDNIVFTIDDFQTDFSNSQQLNAVNYTVNHFGLTSENISKNDKVNFEYLLNHNKTLDLTIVFDPSVSQFKTVQGTFTAKFVINYVVNNTSQAELHLNLKGNVDSKEVVTVHGIDYSNMKTVSGVPIIRWRTSVLCQLHRRICFNIRS